jgi:hypothetical protein
MGRRQCEEEGCSKWGIGDTGFCKTRGGGKRFQHAGCLKSAVSGGTPHCKAHGAAGAASTRAASRQLLQAARSTARRMAGASDAKRRAAPSPLKATQLLVSRMAGAGAASTRATSRRLEAIRSIVSRMAVASAAKRRAAPSRLEATRNTVSRMEGAGDANTRAVPRQLLQAARYTSDELTVLYSNGPDDRSVNTLHCQAHGGGRRCQQEGCTKPVARAPGSVYCTLCLQRDDA